MEQEKKIVLLFQLDENFIENFKSKHDRASVSSLKWCNLQIAACFFREIVTAISSSVKGRLELGEICYET